MTLHALDRRQFLRSTLAAAVVPTLAPCSRLGRGAIAPSERVTLGCSGLGIQGTGNMKAFLGNHQVRVVAVCDVHQPQLEKGKEAVDAFYGHQDCAASRDFRELLARPDLDAIQITTPDHWHPLIGLGAAYSGVTTRN